MSVLVFIVSIPIAIESMAAFLGVIDSYRHPEFLPRKVRKCAMAIAVITLWLIVNQSRLDVVLWAFGIALGVSLGGHYVYRIVTALNAKYSRR